MDRRIIGILGGEHLSRLFIEAANRLGVRVAVLDPGTKPSWKRQCDVICKHFISMECDVLIIL
jgi:phosphoribosylaminoimidazole carboxylase (NCAIR synthetase)